jgi:hypothetical protein
MQGIERVPDAIEPLIGYRAWYFAVERHRASLFPISAPDPSGWSVWDGADKGWVSATCRRVADNPQPRLDALGRCVCRQQVALRLRSKPCSDCDPDPHPPPGERCSCGFYAMKTLESVEEPSGPLDVILGRVELTGKVIEYTFGYRAERARITQLTPVAGTEQHAMRLANHLGLPMTKSVPPWFIRGGIPEV